MKLFQNIYRTGLGEGGYRESLPLWGLGLGLSKPPTSGRNCGGYGAGLQGTGLQVGHGWGLGAGSNGRAGQGTQGLRENAKKSGGRSAGHGGGA